MYSFEEVLKMAKSMKRAVVHIAPNYMLGSDEEFCTLSMIIIDTGIDKPITSVLNEIIDNNGAAKLAESSAGEFLNEYTRYNENYYYKFWNEELYREKLFSLLAKVNLAITCRPVLYTETGLEKNQEFMASAKLKAGDGLSSYKFGDQYLVTGFYKVHPINANDKVDVTIYDLDDQSCLYEYIIDKKKYKIKEYIRYRKMLSSY